MDLCRIEAEAISRVVCAMRTKEAFYREKAGVQWLEFGDRCTHFFHVVAKINASRRKFSRIIINNNLVEKEVIIANHVCDYYQNLYNEGNVIDN